MTRAATLAFQGLSTVPTLVTKKLLLRHVASRFISFLFVIVWGSSLQYVNVLIFDQNISPNPFVTMQSENAHCLPEVRPLCCVWSSPVDLAVITSTKSFSCVRTKANVYSTPFPFPRLATKRWSNPLAAA